MGRPNLVFFDRSNSESSALQLDQNYNPGGRDRLADI